MKTKILIIAVFSLLQNFFFAQEKTAFSEVKIPENYTRKLNIVYTKIDNWEGKLDLYYPSDKKVPTPLVINIHGGGWNHGSKESQTGFGSFFKKGIAVANIEYRLESQGKAPAAVEDTKCALNYLIQNAEKFNIDTDKIIIMGSSAGAHLAMMAGFSGHNSVFDKNCPNEKKVKIFAVINKYGISDLAVPEMTKYKSARNWLGDNVDDMSFVKSVSPLYYVNEKTPPTFIVHGNKDSIVPYSQSEELYKKLRSYGVKTEFITVENGGHGKFSQEEKRNVNDKMWQFLEELGL
ncbi:MAG: alpha/beta hydrolase [Bergeyella sp.]